MIALIACGGASTLQPPPMTPSLPPTAISTPTVLVSPTSVELTSTIQPTTSLSPTVAALAPTIQPTTPLSPTVASREPTIQPIQQNELIQEGNAAVNHELRYLALGDSYTIGENVEVSERWPVQLVQRLRGDGVLISDPEIVARTGWTTAELANGIASANPAGPFTLVTLMIGVNNQFRGLNIEQYRKEFSALVLEAVHLAGDDASHVIVVSTPDWGVTPFALRLDQDRIAREIDQFNFVAHKETVRKGAIFVDVTGISRLAVAQPNLLAPDGLHPSGIMYSQWVELLFPAAIAIATDATTIVP